MKMEIRDSYGCVYADNISTQKSSCNFTLLVRKKKTSRDTSRPIKQQTNQSINHSLSQLTNQSNAENLLFPCVALLTICFWHHRKKGRERLRKSETFFFPLPHGIVVTAGSCHARSGVTRLSDLSSSGKMAGVTYPCYSLHTTCTSCFSPPRGDWWEYALVPS